jgi:hypothetical protein
MVAVPINRAKRQDQVAQVITHLIGDGLSILQYADDTIIFMDHDIETAKNLNSSYVPLSNYLVLK